MFERLVLALDSEHVERRHLDPDPEQPRQARLGTPFVAADELFHVEAALPVEFDRLARHAIRWCTFAFDVVDAFVHALDAASRVAS